MKKCTKSLKNLKENVLKPFTTQPLLTLYNPSASNLLQPSCNYPSTNELFLILYNPAESNLLQPNCF